MDNIIKNFWMATENIFDTIENIEMNQQMNQKKQPNCVFIEKELAMKVIMDLRTTTRHRFRTRLGFKQNNVT